MSKLQGQDEGCWAKSSPIRKRTLFDSQNRASYW